jgi:hypothetical protein
MKTNNTKTPTAIGRNRDQVGDANLASDGMNNSSRITTKTTKYSGNQHGGKAGGNYGRGPVVGNNGTTNSGPAKPPTAGLVDTAGAAKRLFAGSYAGAAQVRTPGGTRPFDPKSGQNYKGNPDLINMGRGPTKGNAQ